MPEARAIISHLVGWSRDVVGLGEVAEVALMDATEAEQVGSRASGGGALFVVPSHSGSVVTEGAHSAAAAVDFLSKDVLVGHKASQFQVRVGDVTSGMFEGDQPVGDVLWEVMAPQDGLQVGVGDRRQPDSSHASAGGIMGTNGNGVVRHKLTQLRWAGAEAVGQVFKIIQLVPHGSSDADAVFVSMAKAFLKQAEEATATRDTNGHAAKFTKGFVPQFGGDFVLATELIKDLLKSDDTMRGELKGFADSVDEPPKDDFPGGKVGITLE